MASVAPSPEVMVERSVVAGSVVEGGAGDVVVAGSPQHFCSYCGVWMSGDPESLRRHYEGARHKDREAKKKEGNYGCICCASACGNCLAPECYSCLQECCSCLQGCCSCLCETCLCENECCCCLE